MPGADEIRSARDDAPPLPGHVQVRRRWTALAVAAVAVSVGLGAAHNGGESARHPPVQAVGSPTPIPGTESTPRVPPPVIWVDPRPRTLAAPVEIRPVLREYLTLACPPAGVRTIPAAEGTNCYRLGPASLVIHKVRHLIPHRAVQPDGTGGVTDLTSIELVLTKADSAAWSTVTGRLARNHRHVAFVVDHKVCFAVSALQRITDPVIYFTISDRAAETLVTSLIND